MAQYAKNAYRNKNGLLDFERISKDVFGVCEDEYISYLKSNVNSYNLDEVPEKEHNEIFIRLSFTQYNRDILKILSGPRVFLLSFYDMRGRCGSETLPMLFMNWHQRKLGILSGLFENNNNNNNDSCGKIFAKFKHDADFRLVSCEGIKPKCNEHIKYSLTACEMIYINILVFLNSQAQFHKLKIYTSAVKLQILNGKCLHSSWNLMMLL